MQLWLTCGSVHVCGFDPGGRHVTWVQLPGLAVSMVKLLSGGLDVDPSNQRDMEESRGMAGVRSRWGKCHVQKYSWG